MTTLDGEGAMPARIGWALELLSDNPCRLLLEIGAGAGVACRPFLREHGDARYIGMDRSSVSERRFHDRNSDLIEKGRAGFVRADFLKKPKTVGADIGLAVNVNAFWTRPSDAFTAARRLLQRSASLLLVYEAPSASRCAQIAAILDKLQHPSVFRGPTVNGRDGGTIARWFGYRDAPGR